MKLTIPQHLLDKLVPYGEEVLSNPTRFIENVTGIESISQLKGNPHDPTKPGIHKDFFLHHDLNERMYVLSDEEGAYELDKNVMQNIKRLMYPSFDIQTGIISWLEDEALPDWQYHSTSGKFFYPGNGGFMGWHTNADAPGMRVYLAYSQHEKGSLFRYYDRKTNTVVDDYDDKGWTARAFLITQQPEDYYWHCVYAEKPRMSIGFRLVQN